jgi:hypothetical protein
VIVASDRALASGNEHGRLGAALDAADTNKEQPDAG